MRQFRRRACHFRTSAACAAALFAAGVSQAHAGPCENLIGAQLPNATVTSAATLSGTVTAPNGKKYPNLPSFCAVSVLATPSADSAINIVLWMPTKWSGRFEGTGNGGYAGNIAIDGPAMVYAVKNGIAVAATDMGTAPSSNNDGDAMAGHPQKWIDFGYRATHVMTTLSKDLIRRFYNRGATYSYFNGCSTGGQQALMTAQRFPADYDGILGGDPANDRTHTHTAVLWIYAQLHRQPATYLTSGQINQITSSVLQACVKASGGVPGDTFLTDPSKCQWSAAALACKNGGPANCLKPSQVIAVNAIYAGPRDPVTHAQIFPGSVRGSENATSFGWNDLESGNEPQFDSLFKWVFGLQWQYSQFDYHQSMRQLDSVLAPILNADNPNLERFRARGGKLMMYHGWADPLVSPQSTIDYFDNVVKAQGGGRSSAAALRKTQGFFRLFMVPGMNHCAGGPGPNAFGNQFSGTIAVTDPPSRDAQHHALTALMQWVERGRAPTEIVATKYVNDVRQQGIAMQRPLCPYPQVARYKGRGSTNAAASFTCAGSAPPAAQAQSPEAQ